MHDLTSFSLATPPGFVDDPAPWWAALRERSPVHPIAPHTVLLRRYADMRAVYRSADVGAVKKREFGPSSASASHCTNTKPRARCSATRRGTRACGAT